jgi:hypothetical protein
MLELEMVWKEVAVACFKVLSQYLSRVTEGTRINPETFRIRGTYLRCLLLFLVTPMLLIFFKACLTKVCIKQSNN